MAETRTAGGVSNQAPRSFSPGPAAVVCGTLVALAALTGALSAPGVWYAGLDKPPGTPPDWLFPVAWTVLYIGMAMAAWRVWSRRGLGNELGLFLCQLGLNALWMPVAFGMQRLGLALLVIIVLWVVLAATCRAFWRADKWAGLLLVPYLLWISYALYLNAGLLGLN